MANKDILLALQKRASIRVSRRLLAANGFPKGSGWEQITEKLKDKHVAAKADYTGLQNALRELLIVGDKNIRVFKLTNADTKAVRDRIAASRINQNSVFTTHFPLPVPDNILHGLPAQAPIPVAKFQSDNVAGVLFSSVVVVEQREKILAAKVGPALAADYEEIIGVRKIKVQTFDAIMISKRSNYVYILSDAHQDQSQTMRLGLQSAMATAVDKFAKAKVLKGQSTCFLSSSRYTRATLDLLKRFSGPRRHPLVSTNGCAEAACACAKRSPTKRRWARWAAAL